MTPPVLNVLKSWDLKLFGLCGMMTDAVMWCVPIQCVGDVPVTAV